METNDTANEAPLQGNYYQPDLDPPVAPPRMSIVPGEGGLGVMFAALAKAQANFRPVKADVTVEVQPRESKAYKFSYAPLENVLAACVPALNAEGFFFSQPLYSSADGEGYVLRTCLMHASGGMIEVQTYIPKPAGRIQDLGSAITYQRRYVAQSLFGVNSEDDDDGAASSGDQRTKVEKPRPQPSPAPAKRAAENGAPAAGPKAESRSAVAAPDAAPPPANAAAAPPQAEAVPAHGPEPANETAVEPAPLTADQDREITRLLKAMVPRLSMPAVTALVQREVGKLPGQLNTADGDKMIAFLKAKVAGQAAGAAS
jgi:hypothetical protein